MSAIGSFQVIPLTQGRTLYKLENTEEKTLELANSFFKELLKNGRDYEGAKRRFKEDLKINPYLFEYPDGEYIALKLLPEEEANKIQKTYGIQQKIETKISQKNLLERISTDYEFVDLYNRSNKDDQESLHPFINKMFAIYREKQVVLPEESKTIALLGLCENSSIAKGAIDSLLAKKEGFALSHLLNHLSPKVLKENQLKLLDIFNSLSRSLETIPHTGKSVNHEIEPLMTTLISVSRALQKSGVENLEKKTKDDIYKALKAFYSHEKYSKTLQSLNFDANYLLMHRALWALQGLVRISSSEHKAITFFRKTKEGALGLVSLADAASRVSGVLTGNFSITQMIGDLKEAYEHGSQCFGIKDIPRPWYEMLEQTKSLLFDQTLDIPTLEKAYTLANEYEPFKKSFNEKINQNLNKIVGKEKVDLIESEEFAFGFVGQLSDIAMDHQDESIQLKTLEILGKIFNQENQTKNVHLFISTTLENIIQQKRGTPIANKAQELQGRLYQPSGAVKKPEEKELFRQRKYSSLELLPSSPILLQEAKKEFQNQRRETIPTSKVAADRSKTTNFNKKAEIGNYKSMATKPIEETEMKALSAAHQPLLDKGPANTETLLDASKTTNFNEEAKIGTFVDE